MYSPQKLLALTACLAGLTVAHAAVLYTENFDNTGGNFGPGHIGWSAYRHSTAITLTSNSQWFGSLNEAGTVSSTTGLARVDFSMSAGTETSRGPVAAIDTDFTNNGATGSIALDFGVNDYTVSFDAVQENSTGRVQILARINDAWYVSNAEITPYNIGNSTYAFNLTTPENYHHTLTLSASASDWSLFTLTPGSLDTPGAMSVAAAAASDFTTGTLSGIGFYVTGNFPDVRLDTFVLESTAVIPEPSAFAALAGCLALGATALRRRRRHV